MSAWKTYSVKYSGFDYIVSDEMKIRARTEDEAARKLQDKLQNVYDVVDVDHVEEL